MQFLISMSLIVANINSRRLVSTISNNKENDSTKQPSRVNHLYLLLNIWWLIFFCCMYHSSLFIVYYTFRFTLKSLCTEISSSQFPNGCNPTLWQSIRKHQHLRGFSIATFCKFNSRVYSLHNVASFVLPSLFHTYP